MTEEGKKISFGFSKLSKKPTILGKPLNKQKDEEKIQFIDCLEEKSIKIINEEIKPDKVLVIPLVNNKDFKTNGSISVTSKESQKVSVLEKVPATDKSETFVETLDSLAAKEILEELNSKTSVEETPKIFAVPLTTNAPTGEKESTLEDYENIPVSDYGLAMLRGMGWDPSKGLGKNEKLISPSAPVLRPKGMGLGADKVIKSTVDSSSNKDEELKLIKGGFVRIVAGPHKNLYGQIEGFDDESGRIFVKLSLQPTVVSFNEFMVQLVSNTEFTKNCKVINVKKYKEYKDKEVENDNKFDKGSKPDSVSRDSIPSSKMHIEIKSDNVDYKKTKYTKDNITSSFNNLSKKSEKLYLSREKSPSYKKTNHYRKDCHRSESTSDDSSLDHDNRSDGKKYLKHKKLHRNQTSSDDSMHKRRSRDTSSSYRKKKHYHNESSSSDSSSRQRHYKISKEDSYFKTKNIKSRRSCSSSSDSPPRRQSVSKSKIKNSALKHKKRKRSHSKSSRRKN